ncbi:hypothetical protein CK203_085679 [Vitis vinifera]|uniref:Uncharacterized protein n=1 Tax=Vitis vinifera TaxID=29760 RepID=A0A438BLK6_VITVI|nr:hypothetical protein CK203_085679 [Vitis vinifera]
MFLLSLPFIPAAKSIIVNSHTCSLQIHDGTTQCLQSEWKWYKCGVNNYSANYGQKFVITVLEESASPAPAPSNPTAPAPNSTHGISRSGYQLLMATMVALAFLAV